jgi:hypothetical protein
MAVYKVPQDIEAEDKFLGPLTFKQFLFGGGSVISGYLIFFVLTSGVGFLAFIFLPFFIFFTALAFPWSKDQPTELFLASRIRFLFVKRKRIWDQTGVKDLVQITVPKREVHVYTDGLDQDQVRSKLSALSDVVDSRGWAVKNMSHAPTSDRLVQAIQPAMQAEEVDAERAEDILDETSAQSSKISSAIKHSEDEHRQHTLDLVAEAREKSKHLNKSVLDDEEDTQNQQTGTIQQKQTAEPKIQPLDPILESVSLPQVDPAYASMKKQQPVISKPLVSKDDEEALLQKIHKKQEVEHEIESHTHLKTIQPLGSKSQATQQTTTVADDATNTASASSATPVDPAILSLAQNDDRSVESLAREANKSQELSDNEVVISLH